MNSYSSSRWKYLSRLSNAWSKRIIPFHSKRTLVGYVIHGLREKYSCCNLGASYDIMFHVNHAIRIETVSKMSIIN